MATNFPIRLLSIFPTFAVTHCFKNENELQQWIDEKKLEIISIVRCGDVLSITAVTQSITDIEKIL